MLTLTIAATTMAATASGSSVIARDRTPGPPAPPGRPAGVDHRLAFRRYRPVIAAVLLYRALTYLPPIPLGIAAGLAWRHAPALVHASTPNATAGGLLAVTRRPAILSFWRVFPKGAGTASLIAVVPGPRQHRLLSA